jgi:hypothetical protein
MVHIPEKQLKVLIPALVPLLALEVTFSSGSTGYLLALNEPESPIWQGGPTGYKPVEQF